MNADNLFELWFESNKSRGESLTTIDNKLMISIKNDINGSIQYLDILSHRHYSRLYNSVKSCIDQRNKNNKPLFHCICNVCNTYLMTQLYNIIISKKSDDNIPDETLNGMFSNNKSENINIIRQDITKYTKLPFNPNAISDPNALREIKKALEINPNINPLDNMLITFGKHKDKTYRDAFNSDREYCIWCIESLAIERSKGSKMNNDMVTFVGYIKQRISKL
jgi:hypothetical protein